MEQSEQNVAKTELPKPAALREARQVAGMPGTPIFDTKNVSIYYGSFKAVTDVDEPASALDPIATSRIEDLMRELKPRYTIVIVTHNMQQATRVSDRTAFFSVLTDSKTDTRTGVLVEYGLTEQIFGDPEDDRTKAYVTGRIG